MKVILQKDMEGLGQAGDILKVSDGYAFNYLIPRSIALPADDRNMAQVDHLRHLAEQRKKRLREEAQVQADKINGTAISIRRQAGEEDKLFGSVTNRDIADALAAEGVQVDRRDIILDDPIKTIGVFTVPIRVHPEVDARLKVYVIRE